MADFPYKGRIPKRIDGIERRKAILDASLSIIIEQGIRAVRHRLVAEVANVPLAATTYYFNEISDLIHDSFVYFVEKNFAEIQELESKAFSLLESSQIENNAELAPQVARYVSEHIFEQVKDKDSRLLEQTLRTQALRSPDLAGTVEWIESYYTNAITQFYKKLNHPHPIYCAHQTLALILRMEYLLLIGQIDKKEVENTILFAIKKLIKQ